MLGVPRHKLDLDTLKQTAHQDKQQVLGHELDPLRGRRTELTVFHFYCQDKNIHIVGLNDSLLMIVGNYSRLENLNGTQDTIKMVFDYHCFTNVTICPEDIH